MKERDDNIEAILDDMIRQGDAVEGPRRENGERTYRLTPQGRRKAEELIATDPAAADYQARLIADQLGKTAVPEPENEQ